MPQFLRNRDMTFSLGGFLYEENEYAQIVVLQYWAEVETRLVHPL